MPRDRLFRAAMDRAGVLAVDSVTELVDVGSALAGLPVPPTDGLGVVTNAGGPGVMATDAVDGTRLAVASLGDDATAALDDLVPEAGSIRNPVDILADASLDRFRESLAAVLADDAVGGAVVLSAPSALFDFADLADIVVDVQQDEGKPVATALMGGASVRPAARRLAAAGIPNFFDPARAVRSLGALADYRAVRDRTDSPSTADVAVDEGRVDLALAERNGRALLDAYGVPTTSAPVPDAIPTVLAAGRDDEFGPVVAFRLADEVVPAVDDVAVRLAPVSPTEADRMLDDLDTAPILRGARGTTRSTARRSWTSSTASPASSPSRRRSADSNSRRCTPARTARGRPPPALGRPRVSYGGVMTARPSMSPRSRRSATSLTSARS
ncbi:acetate--CoA ligase family protein [Halobacteriaceae archaeon GCM10025711]